MSQKLATSILNSFLIEVAFASSSFGKLVTSVFIPTPITKTFTFSPWSFVSVKIPPIFLPFIIRSFGNFISRLILYKSLKSSLKISAILYVKFSSLFILQFGNIENENVIFSVKTTDNKLKINNFKETLLENNYVVVD